MRYRTYRTWPLGMEQVDCTLLERQG